MVFPICRIALLCTVILQAADPPPKQYIIQTVAGTDFVGDGGAALSAILSQTEGIAVDVVGNVYVADADDNRVRKISLDGSIQTIAGTGTAGFGGDGGLAITALLNHPYGLALDAAGNLFIADLGNARVRRISTAGTITTVAGGGDLTPGGNGDGSPAALAKFTAPRNIALEADGTLYVSDFSAQRVYRISPSGILTTLAGNGTAGYAGDNASASLAELNSPAGVACDGNGAVYIADSANARVRKVFQGVITTAYAVAAPTGLAISPTGVLYIAGVNYFGTPSKALAGIPSALDVAVDRAGNVYASLGQTVRKAIAGGSVSTIAGSGASRYFSGDNGLASAARLHQPAGIAVDDIGNWYIADTANNRIRKITPAGIIVTVAGTGVAGSTGDNGLASLAQLNAPQSVAIDSQRNIYVADTGNNRVRKITVAGIIVPVAAQFSGPEYVALDSEGALYIADTGNNRIVKVTASGVANTIAQVLKPAAVTVDQTGNVYVSELNRVSKITPSGAVATVIDGLNSPGGLVLTSDGALLVAETGGNVIRRWSDGVLTTIAGSGVAGFSGDGGLAAIAQLNAPFGIGADLTGTVWFTDSGNNRLRTLTPSAIADIVSSAVVVNGASMAYGTIAPGEIVTIFGTGFDPATTQLSFDGQPATIFYAGPTQINALAPASLVPHAQTAITIAVNGTTVASISSAVATASPGIFTAGDGTGQAAALNEDGSYNSAANPAARGSIAVLYATGQGSAANAVSLKIGGYTADLLYAGPAPGFPGLMQINARIPAGFAPAGILPVVLTVANIASQDGVTIAVQ